MALVPKRFGFIRTTLALWGADLFGNRAGVVTDAPNGAGNLETWGWYDGSQWRYAARRGGDETFGEVAVTGLTSTGSITAGGFINTRATVGNQNSGLIVKSLDGLDRFAIYKDSSAEPGGGVNTGSGIVLRAYGDDGSSTGIVWNTSRVAGDPFYIQRPLTVSLGKTTLAPATAAYASLRIPARTAAVTSPVTGDVQNTGSQLYVHGLGIVSTRASDAQFIGSDGTVGAGWNSIELNRGIDVSVGTRKMTYGYHFADKGLMMRVAATQTFANDFKWQLISGGGTRLQDGWSSEVPMVTVDQGGTMAVNGATKQPWGSSYKPLTLSSDSALVTLANTVFLLHGLYNDGTNSRATATGGYASNLYMSSTDGSLTYDVSATTTTAGGIITDLAKRFSVSRQGGVGFFGATPPTVRPTLNGTAGLDLAQVQALVNQIRANLIACGMMQ